MGIYSFVTSDTKKSIPVDASNPNNPHEPFAVHMISPDGTVWKEDKYEGYGKFGGKDIHALIAELNWPGECLDPNAVGLESANESNRKVFFGKPFYTHEAPNVHCQMCFGYYEENLGLKTPRLTENPPTSYSLLPPTICCWHQGCFYPSDPERYEEDLRDSACSIQHDLT